MTTDEQQIAGPDTMTLTEHLGELRVRIIRSALAVAIGMVLIIAFYDQVLDFLIQPYVDLCARKPAEFCDPTLNTFSPTEGLATRIRVGMYGGIIAALPVLLWQVWRFTVPALNAKEKKYAVPFVLSSVVLFAAGGVLAYFAVGQALEFLIAWSGEDVDQIFSVTSYVALIGLMIFAFGIGFLLPVFIVALQLVGAVTPRRTRSSSTASSSTRSTPSTTAITSWSRRRPAAARPSSPSTASSCPRHGRGRSTRRRSRRCRTRSTATSSTVHGDDRRRAADRRQLDQRRRPDRGDDHRGAAQHDLRRPRCSTTSASSCSTRCTSCRTPTAARCGRR
jgi:sec-independent protein translocase protein TatC